MDKVVVLLGKPLRIALDDEVVIIGAQGQESIDAGDISRKTDCIFYEILCRICPKIPRVYLKDTNK
jgi:alanine racemase